MNLRYLNIVFLLMSFNWIRLTLATKLSMMNEFLTPDDTNRPLRPPCWFLFFFAQVATKLKSEALFVCFPDCLWGWSDSYHRLSSINVRQPISERQNGKWITWEMNLICDDEHQQAKSTSGLSSDWNFMRSLVFACDLLRVHLCM